MEYYNKYFEGVFWLPEREDRKIISTLFIDKNGIATITSLESLEINEDMFNRVWNNFNLVLGYINCNEKSKTYSIKLYDVNKSHQSRGRLTKFKYTCKNPLISQSYDEQINSNFYNSLMLNSVIINNWIPISGFENKSNIENRSFEVNQSYKQPEIIELFNNKDYNIYLFFRASAGYKNRRQSFINENVFINIETIEHFEIKELPKIKSTIERLFNLLLFKPFYFENTEIRTTNKKDYKVVKKQNELNPSLNNEIEFEIFKNQSQNIILKWFEKQDKLGLAVLNFFSVFGQKGVLIENKFLTYISILENYHKNHIKKNQDLKWRIKYLLENSSIKNILNDIEKFSEILKTTRNYHAHLEEKHKEKSLNTEDIYKANNLLEFIIREILLREIGIIENSKTPSEIIEFINILNE
ncbi:HEPN domain-containing protein [uncultured Polaribacter sp.]|uniref:HEPN domain-containing protein n=1 Tax=uncultured Polaribacter sp. TaxID=174711 RepID=UPI00261FD122|nr:HEPN domain-containing protein [uncultured Polaribacter sp.]